MREEFMIERQGKQFVLYAGLLDEFHTRFPGEKAITTELLQPPNPMNENICIVKARVEARNADGQFFVFEGIGDASPGNVSRNIAPHIIRMAETRAKARALRDAINVGVAAFEELGGNESEDNSTQKRNRPESKPGGKQGGSTSDISEARKQRKPDGVSEGQIKAITNLVDFVHGITLDKYELDYMGGQRVAQMTADEARAIYTALANDKKEIQREEQG